MKYQVIYSREAEEDLERLFDHVLERELNSPTGDLDIPARAIESIKQACELLVPATLQCSKSETPIRSSSVPYAINLKAITTESIQ
mgnify:CR=1 FL=1